MEIKMEPTQYQFTNWNWALEQAVAERGGHFQSIQDVLIGLCEWGASIAIDEFRKNTSETALLIYQDGWKIEMVPFFSQTEQMVVLIELDGLLSGGVSRAIEYDELDGLKEIRGLLQKQIAEIDKAIEGASK